MLFDEQKIEWRYKRMVSIHMLSDSNTKTRIANTLPRPFNCGTPVASASTNLRQFPRIGSAMVRFPVMIAVGLEFCNWWLS